MARLMSIAEIVADRELVSGVTARAMSDDRVDMVRPVESLPEGVYFMLDGGRVMRISRVPRLRPVC